MANMNVILLERIPKLGHMGDEVSVKPGFARNYLLPQGKALRANKENRERFEKQRAELEARNLEAKKEAEAIASKLEGSSFVVIRQAGETGQLYGSVSTRDIALVIKEKGFDVYRSHVLLQAPIKVLGLSDVIIRLHPEVETQVQVNVARTEDEAERQARGEDVTSIEDDDVDRDFDGRTAADFEDEDEEDTSKPEDKAAEETEGTPDDTLSEATDK